MIFRFLVRARVMGALIKRHHDVGTERTLNRRRFHGSEEELRSVDMGGELHAVVFHLAQFREAEHLKTAAVRENRVVPGGEPVKPSRFSISSGPVLKQMIGIAENDLRAEFFQLQWRHCLDRAACSDRHEYRSLNRSVRCFQ